MKHPITILFLIVAFSGLSFTSFDDRGGKKTGKKVLLNVNTSVAKKNSIFSQNFNGVKYKGMTFSTKTTKTPNVVAATYQKGNTIYIQPIKQKILTPEFKQGYGGIKLIIKVN